MKSSKLKKITISVLLMLLLTIPATLFVGAAYTQGTVNVNGGWWSGKFTSVGSNSKPSYGTFTTTSVSTGVSLSGGNEIVRNVIWGVGTITQQGTSYYYDNITMHSYSGNRVVSAQWLGSTTTIYGQ